MSCFKLHFMGEILAKIHSRQPLCSLERSLGHGRVLGEVEEDKMGGKKTARRNWPAAPVLMSQHSLVMRKVEKKTCQNCLVLAARGLFGLSVLILKVLWA